MMRAIRTDADRDPEFGAWITNVIGAEKIKQCIHCGQCSGSCPLAKYMDRSPRQLMHLAREGFRDEVLQSSAIWLCTSCYTCTIKCPRGIKVTDVMYALKRRAIEDGVYAKRFSVPVLAQEFQKMVAQHGRINEIRLATILYLKTNLRGLPGRALLGRDLMRTGRFSLKNEKIRGQKELQTLLDAAGRD